MTTYRSVNVTCAVCGTVSEQEQLTSTNAMGPQDLDTRPPPMQRHTLRHVIQRCPTCGCCAPHLDEAPALAGKIITVPAYLTQLHDDAFPELARTYLCWALICEGMGEYNRAGWAALAAAWVCDDAVDDSFSPLHRLDEAVASDSDGAPEAAARACRRRAIAFFLTAREYEQTFMQGEGGEDLLLTDLYRRCGEFALARLAAERGLARAHDEAIPGLLRGQLVLIARGDVEAHTMPDAFALGQESN